MATVMHTAGTHLLEYNLSDPRIHTALM